MLHRHGASVLAGLSLVALLSACGDDGDKSGGQEQAIGNADCSDPGQNPYAEIECVNTFMGDCFVPTGMCMGVVSQAELGKTTLTWESGHTVVADPYFSLDGVDFSDPQAAAAALQESSGADITITGANGVSCASGTERMKQMTADGTMCEALTIYTNSSGQTLTYCFDASGNGTVSCSSNGMTYDVSGGKEASNCQSGSQATGQCTVEVEELDTSSLPNGATLPGQ
jgi:hypothetical protein